MPPPLCDCARAGATFARGGGAFDACVGFDAPVAVDAEAEPVAGFASGFLLLACAVPVDPVVVVAAVLAAVAAACFAAGVGLPAAASLDGSDFVGAFAVLFAAVVFTSLGARSMVVGLGVSCVVPPAGLEADGVDLAPDGAGFAPGPEPSGLGVDVAAALGVRDRADPVEPEELVDREDPVDRDFEVGRLGDFAILWSLLHCFWMEETVLPTSTRYIRQI